MANVKGAKAKKKRAGATDDEDEARAAAGRGPAKTPTETPTLANVARMGHPAKRQTKEGFIARKRSDGKPFFAALRMTSKKDNTGRCLQDDDASAATRAANPGTARHGVRRKRIRLGDAMRLAGLDERAIAENYAGVVEKLTNAQRQPNDGAEKLLVEVLKECTRVLEPPLRAGGAVPDVPVTIHLMHNVPRPRRETASAGSRAEDGVAKDEEQRT